MSVCSQTVLPSLETEHTHTCVLFAELSLGLDLCLELRSFVHQGRSWEQSQCVPIGGPWSSSCFSLLLGDDEHNFTHEDHIWQRLASTLGMDLHELIAMTRYVDDIFSASCCVCTLYVPMHQLYTPWKHTL